MAVVETIKIHKDYFYRCDRCGGQMVFDHTQDVLGTNVHVHNCDRCDDWIDLDKKYPYSIEVEGCEV